MVCSSQGPGKILIDLSGIDGVNNSSDIRITGGQDTDRFGEPFDNMCKNPVPVITGILWSLTITCTLFASSILQASVADPAV